MNDPIFDKFVAAWHDLTDQQRERFVYEYAEAIYMSDKDDQLERLMPSSPFYDSDEPTGAVVPARSRKEVR